MGAKKTAGTTVATIVAICWRAGVAPTMRPVFRSCATSPAAQVAQQTTPAIPSVASTADSPEMPTPSITAAENSSATMVMPDTGEVDDPTSPAMYVATATNTHDATIISVVASSATPVAPTSILEKASGAAVVTANGTGSVVVPRFRAVRAVAAGTSAPGRAPPRLARPAAIPRRT